MPPSQPYDWSRARAKWESSDPFFSEGTIVFDESPPGGLIGLRRRAETGGWVRGTRASPVAESALPPVEPPPLAHRLRYDPRLTLGMVTLTTLMRFGEPIAAVTPVHRVRMISKMEGEDDMELD